MVKSGTITLTVTAPVPVVGAITINASATTVTVGQTVTFTGVVTDTTGVPMVGVTVYLFVGASQIMSGATGTGGTYSLTITTSQAGTYQIDVSSNANNT